MCDKPGSTGTRIGIEVIYTGYIGFITKSHTGDFSGCGVLRFKRFTCTSYLISHIMLFFFVFHFLARPVQSLWQLTLTNLLRCSTSDFELPSGSASTTSAVRRPPYTQPESSPSAYSSTCSLRRASCPNTMVAGPRHCWAHGIPFLPAFGRPALSTERILSSIFRSCRAIAAAR